MERATKASTEGAARDTDAEDAAEDSDGPGPDPGRAHGSSGVHKDPDNESLDKKPSGADGTQADGSADRTTASRQDFDSESRPSSRRISFRLKGDAPEQHAKPLDNTTPPSKPLGDGSRGSPHTADRDGEHFGGSTGQARFSRKSRDVGADLASSRRLVKPRWSAQTPQHQGAQ